MSELQYEPNVSRPNKIQELQYEPTASRRNKMKKIENTTIPQKKALKHLKKLAFIGGMACTLWTAKDITTNVIHNLEVAEAMEPISMEAKNILDNNHTNTMNESQSAYITKYHHASIADEIKEYQSEMGDIYAKALIAEIMESIPNEEYPNIDLILGYLGSASNMEEYIHVEGYETEKEFITAMREKLYQRSEEEKVRDAYLNKETEGRAR